MYQLNRKRTAMSHDFELFSGTAQYYSKYRTGYTRDLYKEVFKHIYTRNPRVLDLGSGPGTVAKDIVEQCTSIHCVDPDPEMIEQGRHDLQEIKHNERILWINSTAEAFIANAQLAKFDLITLGSSFHWMNTEYIKQYVCSLLNSNGVVALLSSSNNGTNLWQDDRTLTTWQAKITRVIQKYLGEERRAGGGLFKQTVLQDKLYEHHLMEIPCLTRFIRITIPTLRNWTAENLIGLLYTSSFCKRSHFRSEKEILTFESDIRAVLTEHFHTNKPEWSETYETLALVGIASSETS